MGVAREFAMKNHGASRRRRGDKEAGEAGAVAEKKGGGCSERLLLSRPFGPGQRVRAQ